MIFQPVIPWAVLIPLSLLVTAVIGYLCAAACRPLRTGLRVACIVLALLAVLSGLFALANPVHVEQRPSSNAPVWLVGLDTSASMAAPVADDPRAPSRMAVAWEVADSLASVQEREIRWLSLSQGAQTVETADALRQVEPDGSSSEILSGMAAGIESLRKSGRQVAGAILITDGRDTHPRAWQTLVSRAGAAGAPVHVVPLGSTWQEADIAVSAPHPFLHAYPGVETQMSALLRNIRMGGLQVQAELVDGNGKVLQTKTVDLPEGEEREVSFELLPNRGDYIIRVASQPGESRSDNNAARITVRPVSARIRVFLAEGSPYWDSKFLAQYLRGQQVFDVRSVHRLSDKRFYHINSGDDDSAPTETSGMPSTLEGLMGYDVIVLGKGMEHLMDASSVQALHAYVREQGGILVLARGRCYAGLLEGMSALEPFIWGSLDPSEHRLTPAADGVSDGLFGQLLPDGNAPVWESLPELEDIWSVSEVRPQTRVLATAEGTQIPLLGLMRYGLGAVACLNGEGLWKWDFYPEARSQGRNMYRDFWRRFLPWIQTAAEFMPGYDLSLHPDRASVQEGEGVVCLLGWRGIGRPGNISVQAVSLSDGKAVTEQKAVPVVSTSLPRWECSLGSLPAGEYILRASAEEASVQSPESRFTVRAHPSEKDNLHADPELLARVAHATGGLVLSHPLSEEAKEQIFSLPEGVKMTEDFYRPLWSAWELLALMAGSLGGLWLIRRRKGLP